MADSSDVERDLKLLEFPMCEKSDSQDKSKQVAENTSTK